ncbi:ABC transporter permease [Parapedobacter sp. ISTM3]|uniref:ABC transporter permease n=1 Tax=Parapedobacter sp. ISTM3 TaxID=2800130 RepID=UPI001902EF91|nr:ABC transporter permease [Parapedobacter sp. ISTM3]MBK1441201.1 ABC transporter permease [Parapedobacter sp. ISTM3]
MTNPFKIAFRNLRKRKLFSFINVTGLTLGLAFAGIIGVYVFEQLRVDRTQPENLYRVITAYTSKTTEGHFQTVGRALIPTIARDVPEVEYVVPLMNANEFSITQANERYFDRIAYAGDQFLMAFRFPVLHGDKHTALATPYSAVLTAPMAEKYFGKTDVVGETLVLSDTIPCTITAVLQELPPSHVDFDVLLSFSTWAQQGDMEPWFVWDMNCYVRLKDGTDAQAAARKIAALSMQYNGDEYRSNGYDVGHELEPVRSIYLHSPVSGFNRAKGNATQLYIFGAIGLALLLLACVNFINLTTAFQADRGKEVGVRKTLGAPMASLIGQFMAETFLVVLLAAVLAIGLMALLLPVVSEISGQPLSLRVLVQPRIIGGGLLLILFTTLVAGGYPSWLLSKLRPVASIKSQRPTGGKGISLRQALVVFQFTVSLALVMATLVAAKQLAYIQNKELGFQRGGVAVISLANTPFKEVITNYESIKHDLSQVAGVSAITASAALPGRSGWNGQLVRPEGFSQDKSLTMEVIPSDPDYVKTLGITIRAGRDFSPLHATDATNGVLINEAACRLIGWKPEEAIGKKINTAGREDGQIVGVMADYHQHGLQEAINPIVVFNAPYAYNYIAVATQGESIKATMDGIARYWESRFPGYPLNYVMLDEDIDRQYRQERHVARVISLFSALTIAIAALGLFGLITYIVMQKKKEIGIRKVLGASAQGIVGLLSRDFVKLVLIAVVIASPIAWWTMNNWLEGFAYRIEIQWWMFAAAGLAAVVIALLTVSWQAVRAAVANPVDSLRDE